MNAPTFRIRPASLRVLPLVIFGIISLTPRSSGNSEAVFRRKQRRGLRVAFLGHSLVAPASRSFDRIGSAVRLKDHAVLMQYSGGGSGAPGAQWKYVGEKQIMKPALETGTWDVLAIAWYTVNSESRDYMLWIDLALEHNPNMHFYIQQIWPRMKHLLPEGVFDADTETATWKRYLLEMKLISKTVNQRIETLRKKYGQRIFCAPVGDAMIILMEGYLNGKVPQINQIQREKDSPRDCLALYSDSIHPTPVTRLLEGYVYYACLYQKHPRRIREQMFPNKKLDRILRDVAWEAATDHRYSGVKKSR